MSQNMRHVSTKNTESSMNNRNMPSYLRYKNLHTSSINPDKRFAANQKRNNIKANSFQKSEILNFLGICELQCKFD